MYCSCFILRQIDTRSIALHQRQQLYFIYIRQAKVQEKAQRQHMHGYIKPSYSVLLGTGNRSVLIKCQNSLWHGFIQPFYSNHLCGS